MHLQPIVKRYQLPVKVTFDKLPKWKFKVGHKMTDNLKQGGLKLVDVYDEHFLLGMAINNGKCRCFWQVQSATMHA